MTWHQLKSFSRVYHLQSQPLVLWSFSLELVLAPKQCPSFPVASGCYMASFFLPPTIAPVLVVARKRGKTKLPANRLHHLRGRPTDQPILQHSSTSRHFLQLVSSHFLHSCNALWKALWML